jgi:hypothetical protein
LVVVHGVQSSGQTSPPFFEPRSKTDLLQQLVEALDEADAEVLRVDEGDRTGLLLMT